MWSRLLDGSPLHVNLTPAHARRRQRTPPHSSSHDGNLARAVDRDARCMVLGPVLSWSRLHAVHIFSRAHVTEVRITAYSQVLSHCHSQFSQWDAQGYPALISDPAPTLATGGISKIGSIQNLLLLSAELHGPWADYDFGVDPDVCTYSFSQKLLSVNHVLINAP